VLRGDSQQSKQILATLQEGRGRVFGLGFHATARISPDIEQTDAQHENGDSRDNATMRVTELIIDVGAHELP
jgi:hypothetical protein